MADQATVLQELQRRRDTLDPQKRAVVDELSKRMGSSAPAAPPAPPGLLDSIGTAAKAWWDQVNPVQAVKGLAQAAGDPAGALGQMHEQNVALDVKTREAFSKGEYLEGVRHLLGLTMNAVPGLGTVIDEAGDRAGAGDVAGAMGETLGAATNLFAGPKIAPKVAAGASRVGSALVSGVKNPKARRAALGVVSPRARSAIELGEELSKAPDSPASAPISAPVETVPQGLSAAARENILSKSQSMVEAAHRAQSERIAKLSPKYPPAPEATSAPVEFPAPPNPFQQTARAAKASELANALNQHGITWKEAKLMEPGQWQEVAKGIGVNKPSQLSIEATIQQMKKLEANAITQQLIEEWAK